MKSPQSGQTLPGTWSLEAIPPKQSNKMPLFFHLILFLLPSPALLNPDTALLSVSQRISRDTKTQPIKVVISEPCLQGSEPCDPSEAKGKEVELEPGAPLVLTHRIRLVQGSGAGCGGCEADFAALRARLERLEREVSELREKCGGAEGGCCTSQQSKGTRPSGTTTAGLLTALFSASLVGRLLTAVG